VITKQLQKTHPIVLFQKIQSIDKVWLQGLGFGSDYFDAVLKCLETNWNCLPYIDFHTFFALKKSRMGYGKMM